MKKIVNRKYKTKSGKVVIKTYTYDYSQKSSRRGAVLVNKKGVVNKKNVQKFKDAIDNNPDYNAAEKITLKADLDAYINQKKKSKEKMTTTGFMGQRETDALDRMFSNAGYSTKEAADIYGFNEQDLRDPKNWKNGTYKDPKSKNEYKINWTYTGSLFVKI